MPTVTIVPGDIALTVEHGESVAEAAWRQGYHWPTTCWGQRECMVCAAVVLRGDEAVERANASEFGLAGTVWGADLDRAAKVAARIETGTVWVNKHLDLRFDVPFGGLKQSGVGREQGRDGLKEFVNTRVVSMAR